MFHVKHLLSSLPYLACALLYGAAHAYGGGEWAGWAIPMAMVLGALLASLLRLSYLSPHFAGAGVGVAAFAPLVVSAEQALQLWRSYPDASHLMVLLVGIAGCGAAAGVTVLVSSLLGSELVNGRSVPLPMALMAISVPVALHQGNGALSVAGVASFGLTALAAVASLRTRLAPYAVLAGAIVARWVGLPIDAGTAIWTFLAVVVPLLMEPLMLTGRKLG